MVASVVMGLGVARKQLLNALMKCSKGPFISSILKMGQCPRFNGTLDGFPERPIFVEGLIGDGVVFLPVIYSIIGCGHQRRDRYLRLIHSAWSKLNPLHMLFLDEQS